MPKHNGCQARQYSDQMYCPKCRITWDVSDPDPPECPGRMAREAAKPVRSAVLDGQEFYDLMQEYRHAPASDQRLVSAAFEAVKKFLDTQHFVLHTVENTRGLRLRRMHIHSLDAEAATTRLKAAEEALAMFKGKVKHTINGADESCFVIGMREQITESQMRSASEALSDLRELIKESEEYELVGEVTGPSIRWAPKFSRRFSSAPEGLPIGTKLYTALGEKP